MPKMTYAEMSAFLDEFFERLRRVRDAGQREYAQDDDNVFANFDRIGERLGLSRETVMMVYALKHVDGVTAHVRGTRSQREGVLGRVEDLIMYLLLFAASETKAEEAAEAFFREGSLSRLFSSPKTPAQPSDAVSDGALAAGNAPRSPEKASDAVYGCLDAAGVHDAFEAARERRAARRARVDAKRAKTKASSAECICIWDEDDPRCPRHGCDDMRQQQHASEADAGDGGGRQLQQHSAAEAADVSSFKGFSKVEGALADALAALDDTVLVGAYCGICESFHEDACDELHARWTPAPTGDARDAQT